MNRSLHAVLVSLGLSLSTPIFASELLLDQKRYMFTFDADVDINTNAFERWTFTSEAQYTGEFAWIRDDAIPYFGSPTDIRPRSFRKIPSDGSIPVAQLINTNTSPGTSTGYSLHVSQDPSSTSNNTGWWLWYGGQPISEDFENIDKDTDRLSMYVNFENIDDYQEIHLGTYLSDGGPKEHGNSHFYHYLYPKGGAWLHILYDRHPSHRRGQPGPNSPTNNPGKELYSLEYMPSLLQMYYEIRYPSKQEGVAQYFMDDMYFYSTKDTQEPDQNDDSISSIWVGYWPNEGYWEIGFVDESLYYGSPGRDGDSWSTYECRWSESPITNANWAEATPVKNSTNNDALDLGQFRKPSSWYARLNTRFTLPYRNESRPIYFAVKDISKKGGNIGGSASKGDGRDSISDKVHTIDYYWDASKIPNAAPKPPTDVAKVSVKTMTSSKTSSSSKK